MTDSGENRRRWWPPFGRKKERADSADGRPDELRLLADLPIGEGLDDSADGLGFCDYADVLSRAAASTRGPFTIGVFGEWGTGKTSLLRMIEGRLREQKGVVTVRFNAWRFEREEHPIVPLISAIVRELKAHRTAIGRAESEISEIISDLEAIARGFSGRIGLGIPGVAHAEVAFAAKDARRPKDPLKEIGKYEAAYRDLSEASRKSRCKVVVLVDDLDRCFPDHAIQLLESIKLVLAQPGFVFVLGVARSVIEGYLQHRYQQQYGIQGFEGKLYFDKIVQLPFNIPPHRNRMAGLLEKLVERLAPRDREVFKGISELIEVACVGNPRATVRFINNLLVDRAISEALTDKDELGAFPLESFAVSRSLQHRWPGVYATLISDDDMCGRIGQWSTEEKLTEAADSGDGRVSEIASAIASNEDLRRLLLSEHGVSWLQNTSQRRSATEFLKTERPEPRTEMTQEYTSEGNTPYDAALVYVHQPAPDTVRAVYDALMQEGLRVYDPVWGFEPSDFVVEHVVSASAIVLLIGPDESSRTSDALLRLLDALEVGHRVELLSRIFLALLPGASVDAVPESLRGLHVTDMRVGTSGSKIDARGLLELAGRVKTFVATQRSASMGTRKRGVMAPSPLVLQPPRSKPSASDDKSD